MKDGFSTQIHIRQNDIGQFGKSGQDAVQKIVIFPTCILQIVRRKSKKVEPKSGKPCGKCGIPQAKQALKLDFWTFSTGFSTCGKIIALLRIVYRVFVENFFLRQNRGISTQQPGKADAGRQNISAKKRKRPPAPRTEKLLQDADKKR